MAIDNHVYITIHEGTGEYLPFPEEADRHFERVSLDLGLLTDCLILFDKVTIDAGHMGVIVELIRRLGPELTLLLMADRRITFDLNWPSVGVAFTEIGVHNLTAYDDEARQRWRSSFLRNIVRISGVCALQADRLMSALEESTVAVGSAWNFSLMDELDRELESGGRVLGAALRQSAEVLLEDLPPEESALEYIAQREGNHVEWTSSLHDQMPKSRGLLNDVLYHALGRFLGLHSRLLRSQHFECLYPTTARDVSLLERRSNALIESVCPGRRLSAFQVVKTRLRSWIQVESAAPDAGLRTLLELRQSGALLPVRELVRCDSERGISEIEDELQRRTAQLSIGYHSSLGRKLRFVSTSVVGGIPAAGIVLGPASSLMDKYLAERILRRPQAMAVVTPLSKSLHAESFR